jgi:hypothetical protein
MNQIIDRTESGFIEKKKHLDITSPDYHFEFNPESIETNDESFLITSGSFDHLDNFSFVFPDKLNIFKKCYVVDDIKNKSIKTQAKKFLNRFQLLLFSAKGEIDNIGNLPNLMVNLIEENSLLIEWIFKDFRIGFSFEKKESNSSWYIASNEKYSEISASGFIKENEIDDLLKHILVFVLSNT